MTEKRSLARAPGAHLTEKRTLAAPRRRTSRKGALWLGRHLQNASLREAPHQKAHSGGSGARRMRLSVTSNSRMRFSVKCAFPHLRKRGVGSRKSAFCTGGLTEKRTLWLRRDGKAQSGPCPQSTPHGKAHSARWVSRKSALWPRPRGAPHQKAHSGWGVTSRMRLYVSLHRRNAGRHLGSRNATRDERERGAAQTRPRETPRSPRCDSATTPRQSSTTALTPRPHPPCARDLARGWVPGSDRYSSPSPSPPARVCHRPRRARRPPRPRDRGQ